LVCRVNLIDEHISDQGKTDEQGDEKRCHVLPPYCTDQDHDNHHDNEKDQDRFETHARGGSDVRSSEILPIVSMI
jgi:hypothetical protein